MTSIHVHAERSFGIWARSLGWLWPYIPMAAMAAMGVALSISSWVAVARWEDNALELKFKASAQNRALMLQSGLNQYLDKLVALRAFYNSSAEVGRNEFEVFSREVLHGKDGILSVSWIPRIGRNQRAAHEAAALNDGLQDYRIRTVGPDGSLSDARDKEEYFPVYFTTERQHSGQVYGLDLDDNGPREAALVRARDENLLTASDTFTLHSGTWDRQGFFVVLPVYAKGLPHNTVEERRQNLLGFVQGVFQAKTVVDEILAGVQMSVDMTILAPRAEGGVYPIRADGANTDEMPESPSGRISEDSTPHWVGELQVADRYWRMVARPIVTTAVQHQSAWVLLIAGLLLTGLGTAFHWSSNSFARRLLRANLKVSRLVLTDPLTALANRRAFLDRLADAFAASARGANPFAVFSIDLDHFKDTNDTLGHPAGDALLCQVAERLRKMTRRDAMVARFGGDEFAVLLPSAADSVATGAVAARINAALATPFLVDGNELHISASIGISFFDAEVRTPEELLVQSDLALYRAKEEGRNCFRFHSYDLDRRVQERVTMGDDLRGAIERGELSLFYQPQVEITSGRIVGMEALLRWEHPTRGDVPPSVFIPIAEKTGSIVPIGHWVFDEACRQTRAWQDQGIAPLTVAVNISAIQCKHPDLEQEIAGSLRRWGIRPGGMEVELTETVLMEVTQQHCDVIDQLRKLGLKIAIDDFGTGYSSLNYLTNYLVDRMKIAQELIFSVTTNSRHAKVVRAAIGLAHDLGVEVIAEGVESEAQAAFLKSENCQHAQGYLFSRPIPAEAATALLRQSSIKVRGPSSMGGQLTLV
jgi:diguanylate cyclase (GGDEF)-like protein